MTFDTDYSFIMISFCVALLSLQFLCLGKSIYSVHLTTTVTAVKFSKLRDIFTGKVSVEKRERESEKRKVVTINVHTQKKRERRSLVIFFRRHFNIIVSVEIFSF